MNLQQRLRARQRIKDTKALKNVPVFAGLSPKATQEIVDKMEYLKIDQNVPIVEQNNAAECLYIIVSGQCSVEVCSNNISKRVGTLHALDFFGENALLDYKNDNRQRNATVTSENTVQLLSLSTKSFIDLFKNTHPKNTQIAPVIFGRFWPILPKSLGLLRQKPKKKSPPAGLANHVGQVNSSPAPLDPVI